MFIYRIKINALRNLSVKFVFNGLVKYAYLNLSNLNDIHSNDNIMLVKDSNHSQLYKGYNELYDHIISFLDTGKQTHVDTYRGDFVCDSFDYVIYPKDRIILIKEHKPMAKQYFYSFDDPDYIHSVIKCLYYDVTEEQKVYFQNILNTYIQSQ